MTESSKQFATDCASPEFLEWRARTDLWDYELAVAAWKEAYKRGKSAASETAPTAEGFWNDKLPGGISAPSAIGQSSVAVPRDLFLRLELWTRQVSQQPASRVATGIANAAVGLNDELRKTADVPALVEGK